MAELFGVPVAELTWKHLKSMSPALYRQLLALPEGKKKIDEIIVEQQAKQAAAEAAAEAAAAPEAEVAETPVEAPVEPVEAVPTPEEAAAAAEAAEAERVIRETAEAAQREAAAEAAKNKRYVIDFQAKDEDGNPIGSKTHLEASSQEELLEKMKTSYENAVRAINRLKKQKPATFKKPEPVVVISQEQLDAAALDLTSDDPAKRASAVRLIASKESEAAKAEAAFRSEEARQAKESLDFLGRHLADYNNCQANNQMLAQFIKDNDLEWTADNLDIAFGNLEQQLAPKAPVQDTAPAVAENPAPPVAPAAPIAAPAAPPAAVAPAPPAAPVPVATAAPANTPARRLGVNGGLIPGQTTSGLKPQPKSAEQARKELIAELKGMSAAEMKRRHKIDPAFYDKVNAALAKK